MNIEVVNRTAGNIQKALENPQGWFGICTIFVLIDQYIFSQWNFAIGFFFIVIIDTIVGSYCAFQRKVFSVQKFRKMLADKFLVYFTIIISFSIGTKITLSDGSDSIIKYLNMPLYSLFITVELTSIVRNWYEYKRWPFLRKIMRHFEGYHDEIGTEINESIKTNTNKNGNHRTNQHLDDNAHPARDGDS